MAELIPEALAARALQTALDAASRDDATPIARRALSVQAPQTDWSPVHLRSIREEPIAVFAPAGEVELVLDARGVLRSLEDPRHAPATKAVHVTEHQAVDAVLALLGLRGDRIDLGADLIRDREGIPVLKVTNKVPRAKQAFESKFFQRTVEEEPQGPPPDRVEGFVNACTGRVYRLRREPPAPSPAPTPEGGRP